MDNPWQPTLSDNLVMLRPMYQDDYEALYDAASDPRIWEQHPANNRFQKRVFLDFFMDNLRSGGALIVIDKLQNRIIGSSRYQVIPLAPDYIEIGWTFLIRHYWGGRYNRAIKKLMINHALQHVDHVLLYIAPTNTRSIRAAEKIGAREISISPDSPLCKKTGDHRVFQIDHPLA